jgi:hypothetical protein
VREGAALNELNRLNELNEVVVKMAKRCMAKRFLSFGNFGMVRSRVRKEIFDF